ncbi:MAG: DUF262 domain-containing HNH endonuclease family protein [Chloroflexota bacterium]|nr:DUF262 domain-containing HNH endonuclease family protein [Chloroflexota bacterium]
METNVMTPQAIFSKVVQYMIPVFQRPYVWTAEQQWEPLWEDVTELAEARMESGTVHGHFMGAVVLQQIGNSMQGIETRVVVDGQQRLTTMQILLDAIQEFCVDNGYEKPAARLNMLTQNPEAFLGDDLNLVFKVWPTEFDQPAFCHAMRNELDSRNYSGNRIVMAHNYFKEQMEQWLAQPGQKDQQEKAVEALEGVVRNSLEFAVISLNESDNPHIIFETLNARGTPLLPSDQIKNHILYNANISIGYEDEQSSANAKTLWDFGQDYWRQEIGRGHQRRPRIDIFLNNWLALRNGKEIRAHNEFPVFQRYSDSVKEEFSVWDVAADLRSLGEIYRRIDDCDYSNIATFLERRKIMNMGAIMPPLMWLLSSNLPEPQLIKSIIVLESYLVRRMICGWSARGYASLFVNMIGELDESDLDSVGDTIVRFLAKQEAAGSKWPDDQELLDAFLTRPLYEWLTVGRLNFVLRGIEEGLQTPLTEIQSLSTELQIEHIMPRGWREHWPISAEMEDEEQAKRHRDGIIHTIGNLTLVTARLNAKLSNDPWEQKRVELGNHSVLFLNKTLLEDAPSVWDEEEIRKRGEKLHGVAIRVWPHADAI